MFPSVVINDTRSTASMTSSSVYSTFPTISSATSKTIVSSVVLAPYIILIGWLGFSVMEFHGLRNGLHLLELGGKFLLVVIYCICYMFHLWLLYFFFMAVTSSGDGSCWSTPWSTATIPRTIFKWYIPAYWTVISVVFQSFQYGVLKIFLNPTHLLWMTDIQFHSLMAIENLPVLWMIKYDIVMNWCWVYEVPVISANSSSSSTT